MNGRSPKWGPERAFISRTDWHGGWPRRRLVVVVVVHYKRRPLDPAVSEWLWMSASG